MIMEFVISKITLKDQEYHNYRKRSKIFNVYSSKTPLSKNITTIYIKIQKKNLINIEYKNKKNIPLK